LAKKKEKWEALQTPCSASLIRTATPAFYDSTDRKWIVPKFKMKAQ
jgi:hypothetical protein